MAALQTAIPTVVVLINLPTKNTQTLDTDKIMTMKCLNVTNIFLWLLILDVTHAFQVAPIRVALRRLPLTCLAETEDDNKAMAFLRKKGKVGGVADFTNAMGVDEGPAGKTSGSGGDGIKVRSCSVHKYDAGLSVRSGILAG